MLCHHLRLDTIPMPRKVKKSDVKAILSCLEDIRASLRHPLGKLEFSGATVRVLVTPQADI